MTCAQEVAPDARIVYVDNDPMVLERFFTGLEMVEPGLQVLPHWRPEAAGGPVPTDVQVSVYGGLARKP